MEDNRNESTFVDEGSSDFLYIKDITKSQYKCGLFCYTRTCQRFSIKKEKHQDNPNLDVSMEGVSYMH